MKRSFFQTPARIGPALPLWVLFLALSGPVCAQAGLVATGIYDEQVDQSNSVNFSMGYSSSATWTTGIGQTLGAGQVLDLEAFQPSVEAAFASGHGGVVAFDEVDPADYAGIQGVTVSFDGGAKSLTLINREGHGGSYSIEGPRTDRTAISGQQFLSTGGNPHFGFEFGAFTGFDTDERVTAVGVTILGRNGQGTGRNFRVIAFYTNGWDTGSTSTFRGFNMQTGNGTQDSFAGIVAPEGYWIERIRVHSDNGIYTSIDDFAFITSVVEQPARQPLIVEDLESLYEPIEGRELTLSVGINPDVNPDPAYQWYFNNAPIPEEAGGSGTVLTIVAGPDSDGTYYVEVSNSAGMASSSIATVQHAPRPHLPVVGNYAADDENSVDFSMGYSNNAEWTTGIGQELGATQVLSYEEFVPRVVTAFAEGRGGVINFDNGSLYNDQSFRASFAGGAKVIAFVNREGHGGNYSIDGPAGDRTAVSGEQYLSTGGNPHFDLEFGDFTGFDAYERVTACGLTILGRNGQGTGRNFRFIAFYRNGWGDTASTSTFRGFNMQTGNGTQDSFAGIVAPEGYWIERIRVHSDSGIYTSIDDLAFITSVVEQTPRQPVIVRDLEPFYQPIDGTQLTLSVMLNTDVNPEPAYQWYFEGAAIPAGAGGTGSSLTITVGPASDGSYYVEVSNSAGMDSSSIATVLHSPRSELSIHDEVRHHDRIADTRVIMGGRAELHIWSSSNQAPNTRFDLESENAWLFFRETRPSAVANQLLWRVRVNGAPARVDENVRVVQFGTGSVIIPHAPDFKPVEVFAGTQMTGPSMELGLYTYYNDTNLGALAGNIRSFRLKRGYMMTVARNANGTGSSRVYIAQDGDLDISLLPSNLDGQIGYVRIFPWRWVNKKGWAGGSGDAWTLRSYWNYDWGASSNSSLDVEYVPMRHNLWWDSYPNTKRNVTHYLGYNEPDRPDQANMSVAQAIAQWPELMRSGLRLGSPAPADSGLWWLYQFIDEADARGYRVDFVAVHFYGGGWNADQLYNWLRDIHLRTGRPLWVTEWNNGANWTCCEPATWDENAWITNSFAKMMDDAPFVERYSVYNWVQPRREMILDGWVTPAGQAYRDNRSRLATRQDMYSSPRGTEARYLFLGDTLDYSGNGNNGMQIGVPTFGAGKWGRALILDGTHDYVRLPPNVGNSSSFTFAGWVRWDGGGNWQRIFDLGNGTSRYLALTPRSNADTLRFTIHSGGTTQQLNAPALVPGEWHHVAVTLGGNTGRMYVDGALVATNTSMTLRPSDIGTRMNYLGRSQFTADPLFGGKLEDIRFLNRAMSASEIAQLASIEQVPSFISSVVDLQETEVGAPYFTPINNQLSSFGTGTLTFQKLGGAGWISLTADGRVMGVPGNADEGVNSFRVMVTDSLGNADVTTFRIEVTRQPGLRALYMFDGNTDSLVDAAHGEAVGSPSYISVREDVAISFNGSNQHVRLPSSLVNGEELTVATWVLWRGGNSGQRIFDFGNEGGGSLYLSPAAGEEGKLRFGIRGGGIEDVIEAADALPENRWYFIAVTLAGGEARLQVDGELVASGPVRLTPADLSPASNFVGRGQFGAGGHLDGAVRMFAVFDQGLPAARIQALRLNEAPYFLDDPVVLPDANPGESYSASLWGMAVDPDDQGPVVFSKMRGPGWLRVRDDGQVRGEPSWTDAGANLFTVRASDSVEAGVDGRVVVYVRGGPDLVAHYQFQGNVLDGAGGRHGAEFGPLSFVPGVFDEAASFNGSSTYVTLPGSIGTLAGQTIAMRIRWDGGADWQRVFEFGNSLEERLFFSPSLGNTGRLALLTPRGDYSLDVPPLMQGEWYHLALALDEEEIRFFVNGIQSGTMSHTRNASAFIPAVNYLGRSQTANRHFRGLIDDFRIYGRLLEGAEIDALATAPFMPVMFEESGYAEWAAGIPFPSGLDGPGADPDGDGVANLLEFLFGGDPLIAGSATLPVVLRKNGSELGAEADPEKNYLVLEVRVQKDREGTVLIPQGAATLEGFNEPEASGRVRQAGAPVSDGEFEVITYYFVESMEDSIEGRGFMRLLVEEDF